MTNGAAVHVYICPGEGRAAYDASKQCFVCLMKLGTEDEGNTGCACCSVVMSWSGKDQRGGVEECLAVLGLAGLGVFLA